jgi:hypothetical protein
MEFRQLDALLAEAERAALVKLLHSHPEWTLGSVLAYANDSGPRSEILLGLTFRELLAGPAVVPEISEDGGPAIDARRLARAQRAEGPKFDELVHAVLVEAGSPVAAVYLRARLGGPRWKLLASLRRLIAAGRAARSGMTSGSRYWDTGVR